MKDIIQINFDLEKLADILADLLYERLKERNNTNLLTVEELAECLKVPKSWVYERTRIKNGIPYVKVGKYVRFNLLEVLSWLKEQSQR
ncbi:MAG: hypothetical protein DRP29_09250 [Thermodesulfobacteriota bacterium]|nr:MAG: hypothetical protein DRP29_09250 [Thermodesulfobacteriota bacterium]